ncbi:MAG TPA: DUF1214 domain-containing protein [Candidatus Binataceae bacterium]|nr:DUF1214 domain-containing protein [Candidatus Binataceae bacterium]
MALHDSPYDETLKRAWDEFCDRLKSASSIVFRATAPPTPLDRATGIQYLSRYISKALNEKFEFADPLYPQFWQLQTPTNKSFGDNPDCTYLVAAIDSEHTYRIVGNRGTVSWVSFIVHGRTPGSTVSAINNADLKTEWDGSFEIIVSPQERAAKNFMRSGPGSVQLFTRQFFGEWDTEQPMTIRIERVGQEEDGPPPPLTPERLISGLKNAADWMIEDASRWVDWVDHYADVPNQFVRKMPAWAGDGAQGALGRTLQFCRWHIQPDEALLMEVTPPRCSYWNFEMANYWWNSVDYRYRFSSLNGKQAVAEDDGSVRIAVSHADPGIPNWLDAGGHCIGMVNQRWVESEGFPTPRTTLVKVADLPRVLPAGARRITGAQRREQLRRRKIGVDRRFPV